VRGWCISSGGARARDLEYLAKAILNITCYQALFPLRRDKRYRCEWFIRFGRTLKLEEQTKSAH